MMSLDRAWAGLTEAALRAPAVAKYSPTAGSRSRHPGYSDQRKSTSDLTHVNPALSRLEAELAKYSPIARCAQLLRA